MLDKLIDRLRTMIKTGTCRKNASSRVRELEHVLEMDRVVGRFTRDKHELAAFLQANIRRAGAPVSVPTPEAAPRSVPCGHGWFTMPACLSEPEAVFAARLSSRHSLISFE